MWSMWNAPSDRDYYDPLGLDDVDEPEICEDCGARWDRACEEWCETNRPASEPVPVSCLAVEEHVGDFFDEADTNEVPRLGDFSCGIAGRSSQPDRGTASGILCSPDV